jgi:hypothetical protein
MAPQQQSTGKLKAHADAMNRLLREMQNDLTGLSKLQQALFNAVSDASGPKKAPRSGIKAGHDGLQKPLKSLDQHVKEYAKHAHAFAEEGTRELDKPKKVVAPK